MYWIRHAKPDFGVHGQSRPLTKEAQQTTNENTNGLLGQFSQRKTNLAQVNNEEINLQGREFGLLVYLMQHVGQIVTKDQIFDRLWGFDSDTSLTVVEVYMSNLRKNLRNADAQVNIKTLRNVGYTLNAATEA